jgi:hypothetical protein
MPTPPATASSTPTRSELESSPLRTTTIEIEHDVIVKLRIEAARREKTVQQLIRTLLDVIVTDRLTTAILDDAPRRTE